MSGSTVIISLILRMAPGLMPHFPLVIAVYGLVVSVLIAGGRESHFARPDISLS